MVKQWKKNQTAAQAEWLIGAGIMDAALMGPAGSSPRRIAWSRRRKRAFHRGFRVRLTHNALRYTIHG
jgi:hypothetical protein